MGESPKFTEADIHDAKLDDRLRPTTFEAKENSGEEDPYKDERLIAFVALDLDPNSNTLLRSYTIRGEKSNRIIASDIDVLPLAIYILHQGLRNRIKFLTKDEIASSALEPKESMDSFTFNEQGEFCAV
jgi:hypothetical protein